SGIYSVYIDFAWDDPARQYEFFYTLGNQVNLTSTIHVYLTKEGNPLTYNPFYYLPFNGWLGVHGDGDRQGYGLRFDNQNEAIVVKSDFETTSDSGLKTVETAKKTDFQSLNISNRGVVLSITQEAENSSLVFLPSIATPVLMALIPKDSKVEAYYYLTDADGAVVQSPSGYLSSWTGSGSTMRDGPAKCRDFRGNALPYRRLDERAPAESCAASVQPHSFGFSYSPADNGEQLYFESVFYASEASGLKLYKTCDNDTMFYSPVGATDAAQKPISIASPSYDLRVSSIDSVIKLLEEGYICVSQDSGRADFWWNPQKVLARLDPVKETIDPNWGNDLNCLVSFGN
ncbi:hypothetical protein DRN67_04505, partial [Candidatus Micrarchaeota archaeon]